MDNNTNFGELRAYLSRTRGDRYPFQGHRLAQEDDYTKNLYLKHLGMVAQAGKSIEDPQRLFLQRLAAGCQSEEKWDAYLRQGGQATPESLEELLTQLAAKDLKTTFLVDAMLLLHLGGENRERLDFLAELCMAMRLSQADAEYTAQLCAGILKQDAKICLPADIKIDRWYPYFSDGAPAVGASDEAYLIFVAFKTGGQRVDLGQLVQPRKLDDRDEIYDTEVLYYYDEKECIDFPARYKVILRNLQISVDKHLLFSSREIEFVDCTFLGNGMELKEAGSLWFTGCDRISIRGCKFKGFGGKVIYVKSCEDVTIEDSEFTDCVVRYSDKSSDWREFGAIVRDPDRNGITALLLRRTRFVNCGGRNQRNYYVSSVLSNCKVRVFDCVFQRCRHLHSDTNPDDSNNGSCCLFKHIEEESGNQVTDSAELGPR